MNTLFTIGFTKKSAREFFALLTLNKIDLIADVRLNNTNQLAGFTRKNDLTYFAELHGMRYEHWQAFTPSKELRAQWLETKNWPEYEKGYRQLIRERKAVQRLTQIESNSRVVLLCAEAGPEHCHRSIAADEIGRKFNLNVVHL